MNISLSEIQNDIERGVRDALAEDIGSGDITAALIPEDKTDTATIITREECILCGQAWLDETYRQLDTNIDIQWLFKDGDQVAADSPIVTIKGNTRTLLTGERTALNFLQLLSGTATKAWHYKTALNNANITLLDTRKTIPGLRTAQKYAVVTGGLSNHRIGLYDAYLIKENHITGCGGITQAISKARQHNPDKKVEVEVENIEELQEAINAEADIIMLDNFSDEQLQALEGISKGKSLYELSGNLSLGDIPRLSHYGVDFVSFGALTKHVQAIDLSFRLKS